jgi:hypothetical protein
VKINERVENILKVSQASRNSDAELLIIYMQKSGMELTPKQKEIFRTLPSMETITRIRRQLQEQGKYEATQEVQEARYEKFKEKQEEHSDPYAHLAKLGYRIVEDE